MSVKQVNSPILPQATETWNSPERTGLPGVGAVEGQVPKVRDRTQQGIKFNSTLLPPYLKRYVLRTGKPPRSLEEVLPWL
jgi:putative transposase